MAKRKTDKGVYWINNQEKQSNSLFIFSLTKRPSVLGQKINDLRKTAKLGSKNFASLNS